MARFKAGDIIVPINQNGVFCNEPRMIDYSKGVQYYWHYIRKPITKHVKLSMQSSYLTYVVDACFKYEPEYLDSKIDKMLEVEHG